MGLPRSDFQPLSPQGGPPEGPQRPLRSKRRKILSNPNPRLHRAGALRRGAEAPRDPRDSRRPENRDLRHPASLLQAGNLSTTVLAGLRSLKEGSRFPWRRTRYVEFFFSAVASARSPAVGTEPPLNLPGLESFKSGDNFISVSGLCAVGIISFLGPRNQVEPRRGHGEEWAVLSPGRLLGS